LVRASANNPGIGLQGSSCDYSMSIENGNRLALYDRTNNAERISILSNGNVGIGTPTPSEKLEVNGRIIPTPAYGNGAGFGKLYSVPNGGSTTVLLYCNSLYRITIKSSNAATTAKLGEYIVCGLNKGSGGNPEILTIKESISIDWDFSFSLNGTTDTNLIITSRSLGDQGLKVIVEQLN
jgi:hypothetical protein